MYDDSAGERVGTGTDIAVFSWVERKCGVKYRDLLEAAKMIENSGPNPEYRGKAAFLRFLHL